MATLTGTAGADLLQGTDGADSLAGLGGDDLLVGGAGNDTLDGGAGNDRAVIDRSASTAAITFYMLAPGLVSQIAGTSVTGVEHLGFTAGSGNDGLVGGAGDDSLAGGAGKDALQGLAGADTLLGGDGADTLLGGAGADRLTGGAGADRFILQGSGGLDSSLAAPDRITDFSADDGDLLVLRGEAIGTGLLPLATGSFGLSGGASLPVGFGGALAARVAPVAGMALPDATGGKGLTLYWQPGLSAGGWLLLDLDGDGLLGNADLVVRFDLSTGQAIGAGSFVAGTFSILGTPGADSLTGTAGADRIHGFAGADVLAGLDGDDTLLGGEGNDSLIGGTGFDSLVGGEGDDSLGGDDGIDVLDGGSGNDGLIGGAGNDLLIGGAGDDWLRGGDGDDSLQGGDGADRLEAGPGSDTLLLQGMAQASWSSLEAMDTVIGFSRAEGDRLRISNAWFGRADGGGADAGTYTKSH
ncbi:calcium-binding protein [Belnapia moabensis]|uniref:calcium-binding protein n=1 Tax=Belnapia moabensis TaxID=365533 RepID=UPI0006939804|nr:calcium-binding protein [Belnapia moabensis]